MSATFVCSFPYVFTLYFFSFLYIEYTSFHHTLSCYLCYYLPFGLPMFLFFMEKNNANGRTGHLILSDHCCPRPCIIPEKLQVRCRPLWKYMRFSKVSRSYRPGNTFAGRPFFSWVSVESSSYEKYLFKKCLKIVPTKPHSCGVQMVCLVLEVVTHCVVRNFRGRYHVKQFLRTLLIINGRECTARRHLYAKQM